MLDRKLFPAPRLLCACTDFETTDAKTDTQGGEEAALFFPPPISSPDYARLFFSWPVLVTYCRKVLLCLGSRDQCSSRDQASVPTTTIINTILVRDENRNPKGNYRLIKLSHV